MISLGWFNVDCASQTLSGAGLFEDLLHLLSLVIPLDVCRCENLFLVFAPALFLPCMRPRQCLVFTALPTPWLFAKRKRFMCRNKERRVTGAGISAEI